MEFLFNFIAGFFLVPILNVIKRYTGLRDMAMLWVTAIVSLFGSVIVGLATGQFDLASLSTPEGFLANGAKAAATVFSGATVLYKTLAYVARK
ncbi:MAG: hypothetical protein QXD60_00940 [Nanopusillaceae archaeon]